MKEGCFEITEKCANNCVHCSSNYGLNAELPLQLLKTAIKDFGASGGKIIELSGGDPTEYPFFEKILSLCSRTLDSVVVFSNNTKYDNATFVKLMKKYKAILSFSILGTKETHNTLSRSNSYEKILSLHSLCKEEGVLVKPHFVLMRQNYRQLSQILEKFPESKVLRLMPQGRAYKNWSELALREAEIREVMKSLKNRTGSHMKLPFCYQGRCTAGLDQFLITPLGSVVPCAAFKRYSIKLGSLYENSLSFILSDNNPRLKKWKKIKNLFMKNSDLTLEEALKNKMCWGHYLHDGMKHPLAYNKMLQEFGIFDADFSKWLEHPAEKYYFVGAHGVGKSTLLQEIKKLTKVSFYENNAKNPFKNDVYRRQLWRLYKYRHDEEMLKKTSKKAILVNRCPLDWRIYTKVFRELRWLSKKEYLSLMKRYNELFGGIYLPENLLYINPPKRWSEERLLERWEESGMKWREDDFDYYDLIREEYDLTLRGVKKVTNLVEINDIKHSFKIDKCLKTFSN